MAKLIPDQLSMFSLWTSEALPNAISSPGSGAGATPSASPGGQMTGASGQARARASRSRLQEKGLVLTIHGTYGPTSIASSQPSGPLSSWENRLRERLAMVGSTECALIWREKVTPAGESISQLSRSTPRTFASASTGSPSTWATLTTRDWKDGAAPSVMNSGRTDKLSHAVFTTTWPTPTKADGDGGHGMGTASATGKREDGSKITVSLPGVVKIVSTWPTPRSVDGDKGTRTLEGCEKEIARKGRLDDLPSTVMHNLSTWPTPRSSDEKNGNGRTGNRTPEAAHKAGWTLPELARTTWPTCTKADSWTPSTMESAQREWDHHNLRGIAAVTTWPTPTSQDCARGVGTIRPQDTGIPLPQRVAQAIGTTTSGSPDQTGKPGALNPAFPCWLMGYPTGWDACAPMATPSLRRSRQK